MEITIDHAACYERNSYRSLMLGFWESIRELFGVEILESNMLSMAANDTTNLDEKKNSFF